MRLVLLIGLIQIAGILHAQQKRIVVAQDQSGNFAILQEAINSVPDHSEVRIEIFIKNGTYREKLLIPSSKTKLSLIGESKEGTIITFDDHVGKGDIKTSTSYTVKVEANDFYAENITFENSAGRDASQAVALHIEADRCIIRNCRIIANQDTLYVGVANSRQYYVDCYIEGTTDFIFGPATVVFENCTIHCTKNSYITAASTPQNQKFGFVFLQCTITHSIEATQVYLGRPWRPFARTVFIQCDLGDHILPAGWHNWNKPDAETTSFYGEYQSKGKGANPTARVPWSHQLTETESADYTVQKIFPEWGIVINK